MLYPPRHTCCRSRRSICFFSRGAAQPAVPNRHWNPSLETSFIYLFILLAHAHFSHFASLSRTLFFPSFSSSASPTVPAASPRGQVRVTAYVFLKRVYRARSCLRFHAKEQLRRESESRRGEMSPKERRICCYIYTSLGVWCDDRLSDM